MKTLEDKTMTGKNRCQPSGWKSQPTILLVLTTLMGSSGGKPEGRRHFGADRFRLENQDNASMSEADVDNRHQSMSNNKRQD